MDHRTIEGRLVGYDLVIVTEELVYGSSRIVIVCRLWVRAGKKQKKGWMNVCGEGAEEIGEEEATGVGSGPLPLKAYSEVVLE
jgi:hypothetical protein